VQMLAMWDHTEIETTLLSCASLIIRVNLEGVPNTNSLSIDQHALVLSSVSCGTETDHAYLFVSFTKYMYV